MATEENPLVSIARSVADGEVVDWDALFASHPHLADSIRNLQQIGSFSEAFQSKFEDQTQTSTVPQTWGHLTILEKIGEGSFGEVFLAEDSVLERKVALKLRRPTSEGELASYHFHLHEARRLARIQHPNVLTVHGVEVHDGRPGIWTDFVEGTTLETLLTETGPVPADVLLPTALELAKALHAVHDADLVHGDVKTANVMRQRDGSILLMDFGAGRIHQPAPDAAESSNDEKTGHEDEPSFRAEGTPIAMAPEVLEGKIPTPAADLYSLGVLLYRIATGRHPVEAETLPELLERVTAGARIPLGEARPDLPEALSSLVERMLERCPEDRPNSASQVEVELTIVLDDPRPPSEGHGHPGNLPTTPHRLIGRRAELLEATRAIERPRAVVSLLGSGGAGKTRLALELANLCLNRVRDGVWWIDLTATRDEPGIALQIMRSLDIPGASGTNRFETIEKYLQSGDRLLIFDNAEQVSHACAEWIGRLRASCNGLRIVVTSRVPLKISSEHVVRLTSLATPPANPSKVGTEITEFDAVRLLVDRLNDARPGFVLNAANAAAVGQICRRLDGIPLALELAAARIRTFSLEDLARRLEENFRIVLARGGDSLLSAHQTLQASIDWSFELLSEEERRVFTRLAVFRDGWTLESAEKVCFLEDGKQKHSGDSSARGPGAGAGNDLRADEGLIADALSSLVEQSLVVFRSEEGGDAARYHMLEMVRETAQQSLTRSDEEMPLRQRHLRFFHELTREAKPELLGPKSAVWFARLRDEHSNLEWALDLETPDRSSTEEAMTLFECGARSWAAEGLAAFGVQRAEELLARPEARHCTPYRAGVCTWLGLLREATGDHLGAIDAHEENKRISTERDDRRSIAVANFNIATSLTKLGRLDEAFERQRQSLATMEELGDEIGVSFALGGLALAEQYRGNFEAALDYQRRGLRIERDRRSASGVALCAHNLATTLTFLERDDEAEPLVREALELRRADGNKLGIASSLGLLGSIAGNRGDFAIALRLCQESVQVRTKHGSPGDVLMALERILSLALEAGKSSEAAMLLSATQALRAEMELPVPDSSVDTFKEIDDRTRNLLTPEQYDSSRRRGQLMDLTAVVKVALELSFADLGTP